LRDEGPVQKRVQARAANQHALFEAPMAFVGGAGYLSFTVN
jgi:hypothetical protein